MEYANTFEKRATGSTVGNGNRERERRKVTWLNDTTLKDLRASREKKTPPTLVLGLHLVINGRRSRSYSGLERDWWTCMLRTHFFLRRTRKLDRSDGGSQSSPWGEMEKWPKWWRKEEDCRVHQLGAMTYTRREIITTAITKKKAPPDISASLSG